MVHACIFLWLFLSLYKAILDRIWEELCTKKQEVGFFIDVGLKDRYLS